MVGGENIFVKVVSPYDLGVKSSLPEWFDVKAKQLGSDRKSVV